MAEKKKYKQGPKYDKAPTIKPINSNKKKNFFSKENLIIILLIISISHNIYLQILTSEASSNASDASDYARRASNNASEAYSAASEARDNSFAYNCSYCPSY